MKTVLRDISQQNLSLILMQCKHIHKSDSSNESLANNCPGTVLTSRVRMPCFLEVSIFSDGGLLYFANRNSTAENRML